MLGEAAVIIDNGTYMCKAGLANANTPINIPCIVRRPKMSGTMLNFQ